MAQARLNGTILDDGGLPCDIRFQYGRTIALGTFTPWFAGGFRTGDAFSHLITGLPGNTIYYFQAECRNALGTGIAGPTLSFITTSAASVSISISMLSATNITASQATLRAIVDNDGGKAGAVRFEYGITTAYGMVTPWRQGFAAGDQFTADILGLAEGQAYQCRAVFQSNPRVYSGNSSFTTLSEIGGMVLIDDAILGMLEVEA